MKRKILSFICCLFMCLTATITLAGCKDEPVVLAQHDAEKAMAQAVETLETTNAIKIECEMLNLMMVATEDLCYSEALDVQSWIKKEGDFWYSYTTALIDVGGHPGYVYEKALVVEDISNPRSSSFESITDYPFAKYSKATELKGEINVVYKSTQEGLTTYITYTINKGKLTSISIGDGGVSASINFEYGQEALEALVEMPTDVEWDEFEPHIEVEGIDVEFNVGDELDLTDAVIKYFEDVDTEELFAELFTITEDMVTGFSTETAGEFTMTVTFFGLTFDIDYTVSEVPVE